MAFSSPDEVIYLIPPKIKKAKVAKPERDIITGSMKFITEPRLVKVAGSPTSVGFITYAKACLPILRYYYTARGRSKQPGYAQDIHTYEF